MAHEPWIERLATLAAGAGGVLCVALIGLGFAGGDESRIEAIAAGIAAIEQQSLDVDACLPRIDPEPSQLGLRAEGSFRFPRWATHRRPLILRQVRQPRPPTVCVHGPPVLLEVIARRGSVELRWQEDEENRHIEVGSYSIYRGDNLSDPQQQREAFRKLADVAGGAFESRFLDVSVTPDTRYCYYVVGHAARGAAAAGNVVFPDELRDLASQRSDPVTTPADKLIWLQRVRPDAQGLADPGRDRIDLAVSCWDPETQSFGRPERFRDLRVGDDPDGEPCFIGEGEHRTDWFLRDIVCGEPEGNLFPFLDDYRVVIEHAPSGRLRTLVEGEKPAELEE